MKTFLTYLLSMILAVSLQAQEDCPCCTDEHRQFDFWVGQWTVRDTLGNTLGENRIVKEEAGCLLSEQWKGAQGGSGSSMNYYDASDSTWNQLWIDSGGSILRLKGRLLKGQMVLKSELQKGQRVDWYYNQITWTPNQDGTVSQLWEIYGKKGNLLQTAFLGIYHRK